MNFKELSSTNIRFLWRPRLVPASYKDCEGPQKLDEDARNSVVCRQTYIDSSSDNLIPFGYLEYLWIHQKF